MHCVQPLKLYAAGLYNYYLNTFDRNSYDDSGADIISSVHYSTGYENAQWNGAQMLYGDGYSSAQDVVTHELTHGVTQYSIFDENGDPVGLEYSDESGALNESYSDIFAVMLDSDDWQIGEDLPSGAIRDMSDPQSVNSDYPDNYADYVYWYNLACLFTDDRDNGCVHFNSNINNKAIYLMGREESEGVENFGGVDVTGIGRIKTEQIAYQTLTQELYETATFDDNFYGMLLSCIDLAHSSTMGIEISDCESVFDAYTAVGVEDSSLIYIDTDIQTDTTSGYGPLTVNFDGSDSISFGRNIINYAWDFGDGGTDSGSIVNHTYAPGSYIATLTITDSDGQIDSAAVSIEVTNPIEATFSQTGDGTAAPATVTFDASDSTDQTGTITEYGWDFGDGSTASGMVVSHTYSAPGTYTVTLTLTDNNGYTASTQLDSSILASSNITSDFTWSADRSPYLIDGSIEVDSGYTLTIEPGTVIKFYDSTSYLVVNGTLTAQGTSADPIVFTSYQDDDYGGDTNGDGSATTPAAGDWRYLYFAESSTANLDQIIVRYGGRESNTDYPMVRIYSDNVTLSNCSLTDSEYHVLYISGANPTVSDCRISTPGADFYGIGVSSGAAPTLTSNTITQSDYGIYISGSALPTITSSTFTNNIYPIYWNGDTLPSDASFSGNTGSDNTYDVIYLAGESNGDLTLEADTGLIPLLDEVTIAAGDLLTVDPGTIVKFSDAGSALSIFGELSAEGATDAPVVFTSFKDDDYGGDTNGDGNATTPAPNDWATIWFDDASTGLVNQAVIRYGGRDYSGGYKYMLRIESDAVTISDSTLSHSETSNIYVYGATPTITQNTIMNAGSGYGGISLVYLANATVTDNMLSNNTLGIYLSNNSNPTITGNVIQDNTYGIYMYPNNGDVDNISNNLMLSNTSYGIYNRDSSATIMAESNWWGDTSGPYHATSNPSGTGDAVSNDVDFDPWLTADPTVDITPPADVTLGTTQKDVWAQTITLNWTNPTDADFDHVQIDRTAVTAGTTTTLSSTETGTSYVDTSFSYNLNYTYTLYACDTSGNCSTGVTTASQRVRNPTPTNLTLTAGNTSIAATWTASSAPASTLGGYKVYYGTSSTALTSVVDVGNVTSTTLTGLTNGTRYYVAISAYSRAGVESTQSTSKSARPHL